MVCLLAAPWVHLSVSAGNGWPHNALRHHWLMPVSCHFRDCKSAAGHESDSCKRRYSKCPGLYLYLQLCTSLRKMLKTTCCGCVLRYSHLYSCISLRNKEVLDVGVNLRRLQVVFPILYIVANQRRCWNHLLECNVDAETPLLTNQNIITAHTKYTFYA